MQQVIQILGWAGGGVVIGAYLALSQGWLHAGRLYHALNLSGALLLGSNALYHGALPSTVLNGIWATMGAVALVREIRRGSWPKEAELW